MTLLARCPPSSDMLNWWAIFERKDYEPIAEMIPSGPVKILDLGAYVGYSAAYFLEKRPLAAVLAVEPDESNFNMLLKNVRDGVIPKWCAVWSSGTSLKIEKGGDGKEWGRICVPCFSGAVTGMTVHELLDCQGWDEVDLIKADIEGAEFEILKDDSWLERTNYFCCEVHLKAGSVDTVIESINRHGFRYSFKNEVLYAWRKK